MSSSDRRAYLTATSLNQALLDATYQDNLDGALEMACTITGNSFTIRASDSNKYVGTNFFEALLTFPTINRKISHWLQNQIEFSTLDLELSNVDGRFNNILLSGADYEGFVGKGVQIDLGLRDVAASYTTIFRGLVTEVGGFGRSMQSIKITARDAFDQSTKTFPLTAITAAVFPDVEQDKVGLAVPVIYGDWTTALRKDKAGNEMASVPAICFNGEAALLGGGATNAKFIIADHALVSLDVAHVYILRGDLFTLVAGTDIANVSADHSTFEIKQDTGATLMTQLPGVIGTPDNWLYQNGDVILVRVVGYDLSGSNSNAVAQAKHILTTFGGFSSGDFDTSWAYYAAKASPAQSAATLIPSRIWVQEAQEAMQYAVSLLAQLRLETFVNRSHQLELTGQHFEEFTAAPTKKIRNWDVVRGSFKPAIDSQNNFNRARAVYDRSPTTGETTMATGFLKNQASITQMGKTITKEITFPNLYVEADVKRQLTEILRLASCQSELISVTLTGRSMLLDLGSWVQINVEIGSTSFEGVPAMVREIGYDPSGRTIPAVLWSMQAVPFTGWAPGYAGLVGGSSATIDEE